MMVRLVQWRALIGIFSCQISGTSTNNRYNRQKVWFYAWKFASTLSLSRRGAYYCHNSSIYFCSFTLPWRYWTKPRTKETKKKRSLSVCHWNLNSWSAHNFLKLTQMKANISMYKHDFICLSETYLDSSTPDGSSRNRWKHFSSCRPSQ